ncbi:MAG: ABC transporter permease [Verrucomicrobiota bacterium]
MLGFIGRKVAYLGFVYLLASVAIFAAMKLIPEDPLVARYGKHVPLEKIEAERERLGLDRSLGGQFWEFHIRFWSGDWENSLRTGRPAAEDLRKYLPATIELSGLAMLFGGGAGIAVAMYSRVRGNEFSKKAAMSLGGMGLIVPIFWIGIVMLVIFGVWLEWFPMGGRFGMLEAPPKAVTGLYLVDCLLSGSWGKLAEALYYLLLPSCCLAVYPMAGVTAMLYARLKEPEVDALYVSLRSKGYGSLRIVFGHLLRVASAPVVTVLGTTFGGLLGGAFLTETVFSWPGIGRYMVSSIIERDLFVAQYLLLMLILLIFCVAFFSDVVAKALDPRGKEGGDER